MAHARFEASIAFMLKIRIIRVVMLSNEVMLYRRFEGTYCLHLQEFRSPRRALLKLTSVSPEPLKAVGSFETSGINNNAEDLNPHPCPSLNKKPLTYK
jgi:hypothetical protein